MEPSWIRPAYLRIMCLVGIVILAWGTVGFVMGIVHVAFPDLQRQSDPVFRIASAVVDVAQAAYAQQDQRDPAVTDALGKAKTELDKQARKSGINELVHGLVFALVGLAIFAFHWRKAEERPAVAAAPGAPWSGVPPGNGGQAPPAGGWANTPPAQPPAPPVPPAPPAPTGPPGPPPGF
jgi:hypothetical protein